MGKLNQGPFQGFIGKTGGLVGKRWKGKYIVAAYQPVVANPKSSKQQLQRNFFKQAIAIVVGFFTKELRLSLSGGFTGITLTSSNTGLIATVLRRIYYALNQLDVKNAMFSPRGIMCSGLDDFGNTIFDNAELSQVGTTKVCTIQFDKTPGLRYFGSTIDLTGLHMITQVVVNDEPLLADYPIEPSTQPVSTEVERAFGFQDSAEECGNWPFVMKCQTSAFNVSTTEASAIKILGEEVNEAFCNFGFYIKEGPVFTSRFLRKEITVV